MHTIAPPMHGGYINQHSQTIVWELGHMIENRISGAVLPNTLWDLEIRLVANAFLNGHPQDNHRQIIRKLDLNPCRKQMTLKLNRWISLHSFRINRYFYEKNTVSATLFIFAQLFIKIYFFTR